MNYHLWVVCLGSGGPAIDAWLLSSDVDAARGDGVVQFTLDRTKAQTFADFGACMACWKAQSRVRPLRPDGKPNRPLSAFTVQPCRADQEPTMFGRLRP